MRTKVTIRLKAYLSPNSRIIFCSIDLTICCKVISMRLIYTENKYTNPLLNKKALTNCESFVVRTGIEPVFHPWKGRVLTPRRTDHWVITNWKRYFFSFFVVQRYGVFLIWQELNKKKIKYLHNKSEIPWLSKPWLQKYFL